MRRRLAFFCLVAAVVPAACADGSPSAPSPNQARREVTGHERASFQIRGASYGPRGEEMTDSECSGTYGWSRDSTNWAVGGGTPIWVKETSYDRVGCNYWGGWSQDLRVGGNIGVYAEPADGTYYSGVGVLADQQAVGNLDVVPVTGTTVYFTASSWGNYRFQYWRVTNGARNRVYNECRADFSLPADTEWYDFQAIFRESPYTYCPPS